MNKYKGISSAQGC